jgi:nucleoside-diphosphate-sugar epimerase
MAGTRTALVLGATGGIGGEMAAALLRRGWAVRGLHRDPEGAARRTPWLGGVAWVRGDAMRPADVAGAARDATLIVHAVNPPGYRRWGELVLPMLEGSIAAARASGARILLPGTVYNYGPDAFPALTEGSPQNPRTRKGAIRAEIERRLRAAAEQEGLRALVVRAGDFFGPRAWNNWFSQGLVRPGRPLRVVTDPGRPGVGHAWAYLPDLAEAMARLVDREAALGAFETFHFAGHWDADGTAMVAAIRRAAGDPGLRVRGFPWALIAAASPFVPLFREIREMRHLWREPLRLDNARLVAALGAEPHTPIDAAVRDTLAGLGCLGGPAGRAAAEQPARPVLTA